MPLLLLGANVVEGRPKTQAGARRIWLDDHTITLLCEHPKQQLAARLAAAPAWQDNDLIFCQDDGAPRRPDYVTRRLKVIASTAGLPVIKLHEGRHSAASLAGDADVDPEIRCQALGHVPLHPHRGTGTPSSRRRSCQARGTQAVNLA